MSNRIIAVIRHLRLSGYFGRTVLAVALAAICAPGNIFGQAAGTAVGTLTGVVTSLDTQKALQRAEVAIKGTALTTFTNSDGSFRLVGVPVGTYTVVATYAGLEDDSKEAVVRSGESAAINFSLGSGLVTLEAFQVAGVREGNAYAVQQQRTSETQRMVVSADAFGIISDSNPGEFLKAMPGMSIDYTGIEARRVSVRGLEPNLVQVLLNGNQVASAASCTLDRAYEFDQTSIDSIESLDVTTAARPDMPSNTIGGTINIQTRSAFMQKGRRMSGSINVTSNTRNFTLNETSGPNDTWSRKTIPGFAAMFSDTFLDGKLGVTFSASNTRFYGSGKGAYNTYKYTVQPVDTLEVYNEDNTDGYISQYSREDHQNYNRRIGSSFNLDYKANDTTTFYFRTLMTDYYYEFRNRFLRLNAGAVAPGSSVNDMTAVVNSNTNAMQQMSVGNKRSRSWSFNPGAKHEFGDWKLAYDGWFTKATAHYDTMPGFFNTVNIFDRNISYSIDKSQATAVGDVTQLSGKDIYSLSSYSAPLYGTVYGTANGSDFVNISPRDGTDIITGGKFNLRRDFSTAIPFFVETGGSYQKQQRAVHRRNQRWGWIGLDGIAGTADDAVLDMSQYAENYNPDYGFGETAPDRWISPYRLVDLYKSNPQAFAYDAPYAYEQEFTNNRKGWEAIRSAYVMSGTKVGNFDILAGLRLESTQVKGEGSLKDNSKVPAGTDKDSLAGMIAKYSRTTAYNEYTPSPLKDVHVKYNVTRQVQTRASYTEAIGRPNIGDLLPQNTTDTTARTVSVSNTGLKPQRARNYDLAVEFYPKSTSYVSAGWFKKDIANYINTNTTTINEAMPELGIGPDLINYTLTTKFNMGKVNIEGYELSGRYALDFLPKAFQGFELWGNYTNLYSIEADTIISKRATTLDFLPNVAPWFWNVGVSYRGLSGKLRVNLKANFCADKPSSTSVTRDQVDDRLVVDGDVSYSISSHYDVSLSARNLFDVTEGGTQAERAVRTGDGGGTALTLTLKGTY